jgi:hypothetical protein
MCADAYSTDVVRIDLDTAAAVGWNTLDAARVTGSLSAPPGLILPNANALEAEVNRVSYVALDGVHGIDSFTYQLSDCVSYGTPATVEVVLPAPAVAFEGAPFLSATGTLPSNGAQVAPVQMVLNVRQAAGTFSLYEKLRDGHTSIAVELKGVRGNVSAVELTHGGASTTLSMANDRSMVLSQWKASQQWYVHGGTGDAELWLSNVGGAMTFRVQVSAWREPTVPPVSCPRGYIVVGGATRVCQICPAGTYEHQQRVCLNADSFHYIPAAGSTRSDMRPCSVNVSDPTLRTQSSRIIEEAGQVRIEGSHSACRPTAYPLHSVLSSAH